MGGWGICLLLFLLLVVLLLLLILILIWIYTISAIRRQGDLITGIASADKGRSLCVVAGVVLFCLRGAGGFGSKHTTIIQVDKLFSLTLPMRSLVSSVIAPQSVSLSVIPRSYRDISYRGNAVYPYHEDVTIIIYSLPMEENAENVNGKVNVQLILHLISREGWGGGWGGGVGSCFS